MTESDDSRRLEALDWARRTHDPTFTDWEAHIEWLERSPENARAFDVALVDIDEATNGLTPATSFEPPLRLVASSGGADAVHHRRRWLPAALTGGAIAAGIAGSITFLKPASEAAPYVVRTGAGETRTIALAADTTIAMNGSTEVRLDRGNPRRAALERGEALFTVTHDPTRPFTVRAGGAVVQDVGTVFDVVVDRGRTDVAVREGDVTFTRDGTTVPVGAGQALSSRDGSAEVRKVDARTIGGWRQGRLTFDQTPLPEVAAAVSRSSGQRFSIDPDEADHRFSGVIVLDADPRILAGRVAAVTGLAVTRDGAGWRIASPRR